MQMGVLGLNEGEYAGKLLYQRFERRRGRGKGARLKISGVAKGESRLVGVSKEIQRSRSLVCP